MTKGAFHDGKSKKDKHRALLSNQEPEKRLPKIRKNSLG
jgi:hypothetical protein